MAPAFLRRFSRRHLWLALGVALVAIVVSGEAVHRYFLRRHELRRMEAHVREAEARVARQTRALRQAEHDDVYMETAARRELGLMRPDEIEYRFVDETPEDASPRQP